MRETLLQVRVELTIQLAGSEGGLCVTELRDVCVANIQFISRKQECGTQP
jgi:hypothetical protein